MQLPSPAFVCTACIALATLLLATLSPSLAYSQQDSILSMRPDKPVQCLKDAEGLEWRLQCDPDTKLCLFAPNRELSTNGTRTRPLERVRICTKFNTGFDQAKLKSEGYTLKQGLVDVPHGWTRDDRGRIFQTNFDLKRRMYFGTSYNPQKLLGEPGQLSRSAFNFGLFLFEGESGPNRHRLRVVEGKVSVEPFSSEVILLHYDLSRRFLEPLLRITTFIGEPERHDLHLDIGLWTEAGHLEVHQTALGSASLWRFGTAQLTVDLWRSAFLDSFLRLRTGLGFERLYASTGDRTALTGSTALELDMVLDRKGFHNLRALFSWEIPRYFAAIADTRLARRNRATIGYEAIVLAINDQPLSLTLGVGGERRNDLPVVSDTWAFVADVGLRISLWAPPKGR